MIHPVTITTPDGVERILRFTHGAELRVERHLKQPLSSLFLSEGKNNLEALSVIHKNASAIAYFCLPWDNGKPPQGIEEGTLGELYSPVEMGELVAALFECISQGAVKKKDVSQILQTMQEQVQQAITGNSPGASQEPISISKARRPRRVKPVENFGT